MAVAVIVATGCASAPPAPTDCANEYWPGTVDYATCYGNVDRQQTEMIDQMDLDEARDAAGPLGGGDFVPPP
jgi:hypothetical protein